ncbi:uncharacterized protein EDB93DRAFT_1164822 [Suillus bovinus]|uniref:uncharacterized protein n=1 Tax=Suillus bovinus TaxID=48563 RepID=UPI001B86B5D3|nr:uncharacterized protein EDB93DRAFT_1164822 [Suillus bovinus]KAG2138583.1 hypothetical protein EDB93DRAFT_1164822 [Suillus bovinus]
MELKVMGAAEVAALLMDKLEVGLGDTLREMRKNGPRTRCFNSAGEGDLSSSGQAPSRHPQSTMRQTGIIAEESLAPMHIWERIDVSCIVFLLHGILLARRMSSVVYFLVFRQFGSSKSGEFAAWCDFNDRRPMAVSRHEERKMLMQGLRDSARGGRWRVYFEMIKSSCGLREDGRGNVVGTSRGSRGWM